MTELARQIISALNLQVINPDLGGNKSGKQGTVSWFHVLRDDWNFRTERKTPSSSKAIYGPKYYYTGPQIEMPQFLLGQPPWQKQNNYRLSGRPFLFCLLNIYISCVASMIFSLDLYVSWIFTGAMEWLTESSRSCPFCIPTAAAHGSTLITHRRMTSYKMICAVWWIQKLGSKWWADYKTSSFLPWVVKMETSHTCCAEQLSMVSLDLPPAASPHLHVRVIHDFLFPRTHLVRQAVALLKLSSAVCGASHDSPGLRLLVYHICVL